MSSEEHGSLLLFSFGGLTGVTVDNLSITDAARWHLLSNRKFEHKICEAFELFRSHGIEPILFKGWAVSRCYPESQPRSYGDIDLAVAWEDFRKARRLIELETTSGLGVDLHNEFRHLDALEWGKAVESSSLVDLHGTPVRILGHEDHLRVVCTHWLNDGGAYKDRLWDIFHMVENRPTEFDWNRCLNIAGPVRREWVILSIGLAHYYLGLAIDELPFAAEAKRIPRWLERALEIEWKSEIRLRPLYLCLNDRKVFFKQIRKRIPPNPVQATVDMEGSFHNSRRVYYQLASSIKRIPDSAKRLSTMLFKKTGT